jgi:hypothetical protein
MEEVVVVAGVVGVVEVVGTDLAPKDMGLHHRRAALDSPRRVQPISILLLAAFVCAVCWLDRTSRVRWQIAPPASPGRATRVAIELRVADSPRAVPAWRAAGSFEAGVLNQAVRYAADRRVVATTITSGDGRAIRRLTYLHPALADTPLGCRIVEADRLVDTFTMLSRVGDGKPLEPAAADLVADRYQMTRWLGVVNLAELVAADSTPSCPVERLQQVILRQHLAQARFSPAMDQALVRFVADRAASAPGSDDLLRKATACSAGPTEQLANCLCKEVKPSGLPARYWFPEDHTSQVRERAARNGNDLTWLQPSADRMAHLDFWTHTTFALRDGRTGASDEGSTAALDFPSVQLAALRKLVADRLPLYLSRELRSPSIEDFMGPLEEFVLAQRLARAALTGRLGPDFPVTKLLQLEQQTRRFVTSQPTIRWEPMGSTTDLHEVLGTADSEAAERFRTYEIDVAERSRSNRPRCDRASR